MLSELGHQDIQTFSIGFESAAGHSGNEFEYSDLIAQRFGTKHEQIRIDANKALDTLPAAIRSMSEPMVSHDAVAFYLLASEVSKRVKVVQSGQGADELFGGYSWYPSFLSANDVTQQYQTSYFDWKHSDLTELLSEEFISDDFSRGFFDAFFTQAELVSPVDKVLQIDGEIMLADDPVKRVDNMTMAFGLEARVPYLDHEVVELASRLPAALKVSGGGKHILKKMARRYVPNEVIDSIEGVLSTAFPALPERSILRPRYDDIRQSERKRFVSVRLYRSHVATPEAEMRPKGHSRLWQAAVLEAWLQAQCSLIRKYSKRCVSTSVATAATSSSDRRLGVRKSASIRSVSRRNTSWRTEKPSKSQCRRQMSCSRVQIGPQAA